MKHETQNILGGWSGLMAFQLISMGKIDLRFSGLPLFVGDRERPGLTTNSEKYFFSLSKFSHKKECEQGSGSGKIYRVQAEDFYANNRELGALPRKKKSAKW